MIAYHATPARNLPAILADGLRPDAPGAGATNRPGVYLGPDPAAVEAFVSMLYGEPVVVLEVDLTGLPITWGDDDDDIVVAAPIPADRVRARH